jgi:hypothetical protein
MDQERIIGKALDLGQKVEDLIKNKEIILESLKQNGVICIKNVDFTPGDLVELTKGISKEII